MKFAPLNWEIDVLRKIGGFVLAYFAFAAAMGACMSLVVLITAEDFMFGDFPDSLVFVAAFMYGIISLTCAYAARKLLKPVDPRVKETRTHEQMILDLALHSNGTLSIAEIAAQTPLSVAEAKQGVEALTREGVASVEFSEEKDVFYRFPGLEKRRQVSS